MLSRGRGHVVFISSGAGKLCPPYQQSYAATKAGLIGVNQSLRAEYASAPVGFSAICPGFETGAPMRPMLALNAVAPRLVARALLRFGFDDFFRRAAADRGRLEPSDYLAFYFSGWVSGGPGLDLLAADDDIASVGGE